MPTPDSNVPFQPFDALTLPITGVNLIEASAGTGKTYSIAALFLRLIVLEGRRVQEVLVVTFTNPAAAELKTRLRARLREAADVLDNLPNDPALEKVQDDFLRDCLSLGLADTAATTLRQRLTTALYNFDEAAIFTIHALCQRILGNEAFLCRVPFATELRANHDSWHEEAAADFWRRRVAADSFWASIAFKLQLTPAQALKDVRFILDRPHLPLRRVPFTPEVYQAAQTHIGTLKQQITGQVDALAAHFWALYPRLNGTSFNENSYTNLFACLNDWCRGEADTDTLDTYTAHLQKFAREKLKVKKDVTAISAAEAAPLKVLADLGATLQLMQNQAELAKIRLLCDLADTARAAVVHHKRTSPWRTFQDWIEEVAAALSHPENGALLSRRLAEEWQVALIDEFQDTDPLQYAIFQAIFVAHGRPLFLVGDPKQAIYEFRGADIHAYLAALPDADAHYTLDTNRRSQPALVAALNDTFTQATHPFELADIAFHPVKAARSTSGLTPPLPAVTVRWLQEDSTAEPTLTVEAARQRAAQWAAQDIAALLADPKYRLKPKDDKPERALAAGDIAVLTRTNNQGTLVQAALKEIGINSVLLSRDSVFASPEAAAVEALLYWWQDSADTTRLIDVLSGALFQYPSGSLKALLADDSALARWVGHAQTAQEDWERLGLYAAFSRFSRATGLEEGLIRARRERPLTNLLQLIEILAKAANEHDSSTALLRWYGHELQRRDQRDELNLRLESDEALVKVVTIHTSKGLEYPVVFCPFMWDNQVFNAKTDPFTVVHHTHENSCTTAEIVPTALLSDDEIQRLSLENRSENTRLLYVALTRARENLFLTLGVANSDRVPHNPLYRLIAAGCGTSDLQTYWNSPPLKPSRSYAEEYRPLRTRWLQECVQQWTARLGSVGALYSTAPDLPAPTPAAAQEPIAYRALALPQRAFAVQRFSSFTALTRNPVYGAEPAASVWEALPVDSGESAPPDNVINSIETQRIEIKEHETASAAALITPFPRGSQSGTCLHELLEAADFSAADPLPLAQVEIGLQRYGIAPQHAAQAHAFVRAAARAELASGVSLAQMPPENRLPEMGFTLKAEQFSLPRLNAWLRHAAHGLSSAAQTMPPLDFATLNGFLTGFIDMICLDGDGSVYVIDYKSNDLGNHPEAYAPAALDAAMAAHHYPLQALIYAIAVARYLAARGHAVPIIHIRYLFLRGLCEGTAQGVWQWDIPIAELEEWYSASALH